MAAVIQEAHVQGVPTRSVDDLVKAMGAGGVSKSQVSRPVAGIDERVNAFPGRPIEGEWPCPWIDATYLKAREGGRIVSTAVLVAVAVDTDGPREVLGVATGASEAEPFWKSFLRSLADRGLRGVKLEQNDEWAVSRRYMTLETLGTISDTPLVSLPASAARPSSPQLRIGAPTPPRGARPVVETRSSRVWCLDFARHERRRVNLKSSRSRIIPL